MSVITKVTGQITTQNLVPAGAATASSAVEYDVESFGTLTVQVFGTYTGALSLQVTLDGTNWITVGGTPFLNVNTGLYLATITSALQSIFKADVTGALKARITALAAVTGTANVTLQVSPATSIMGVNTALPAGAAALGSVTVASGTITPITKTSYSLPASLATTNPVSIKATPGSIFSMTLTNMSAATKWVKFYAKASAPTVGTDIPTDAIEVTANSCKIISFAEGLPFLLGIAMAITGAQPDADTTAIAAGDMKVHIGYI